MLDAILAQSRNTALIMGLVALIGLLLQKKSAVDTISGTVKTVIGFMVFNIGSNAMSAVVNDFTTLFNTAFGIAGVTTQVELATALALDTYGTLYLQSSHRSNLFSLPDSTSCISHALSLWYLSLTICRWL